MPAGHCSTPHISTGQDLAQVGHVFSTVKYFIANQLSAIGTASQCSHVMSCLLCTCLLLSRALSSRLVLFCPILSSLVLSCWKCHCQFTASQFPKMSRFVSSCLVSSCLVSSYFVLSYLVSFCLILSYQKFHCQQIPKCSILSSLVSSRLPLLEMSLSTDCFPISKCPLLSSLSRAHSCL